MTLRGYFDQPFRHSAVVDIIQTTEGVTAFDDQSKVLEDYYRSDKDLEALIYAQVLAMPFHPGEWIEVEVCGGVATLKGCVFRAQLKAFASRAAWELSGIKDCIIEIDLQTPPATATQAISEWAGHREVPFEKGNRVPYNTGRCTSSAIISKRRFTMFSLSSESGGTLLSLCFRLELARA